MSGWRVVFYDPLCPAPYSLHTLQTYALGGSEASTVRVAEALDAAVMQHCRRISQGRYLPPAISHETRHVVVLRDARAIAGIRSLFPNARFHVWLHDLVAPGSSRARWLTQAQRELAGTTLICVSDFLRRRVESVVTSLRGAADIAVRRIYNPIEDDLESRDVEIDSRKLVYVSSPNKGLDYVLTAFEGLRRACPALKLHVANPGYRQAPAIAQPGVHWLGTLTPAQTMVQLRNSLCVFMPNFILPETFGLVFAEANAVGTPVLTHDGGAAREVLHASNPVLAVSAGQRWLARAVRTFGWRARLVTAAASRRLGLLDDYAELLKDWQNGRRPRVSAVEQFRLGNVAAEWRELLA